jgi:DNA-binding NarL/FixJ family response regulator
MIQGQDSAGLITHLRQKYPWLPILVFAPSDGACDTGRALYAGAQGCVTKPESPEKIIEAIHRVLKEHAAMGEQTTPTSTSKAYA